LGLQLFTGAAQLNNGVALLGQNNIAWQAHLGGFLAGLLMFYAIDTSSVSATRKL
jgi:membrane associated rhomboid family serine protease